MKNILLGVTGSIAAYKAADLANQMTKIGYNVEVIMTESAVKFITPLTLQALTKNKVYTDMFDEITPEEIKHISLAKKADVFIIAPATANIIGKIANGIADDFLSTVILALKDKPVFLAPAMNTNMYENPIVQENIEKLKARGFLIIEPR
ncbi:MAG: phosphopantothenoylcysteine decarboxylase, partial [Peptostreptococcaceae bacterium]|nr:phosphopantothenoylcysteine decarboxylase [Peptostreptococcaceae bacterium]